MCSSTTTLEETRRIDIRYMRQQGLLRSGYCGSLSWHRGGEPNGYIRYSCHSDYLQLDYSYRKNGQEWQPVTQKIYFDRTSCNYGGERLWFSCPNCRKRVAILSGYGALFLCRHCYQLPYASSNESRIDRAMRRKHNLGRRIFEHYECGEGWGKKKGLHWKTFNKLAEKYELSEKLINMRLAPLFNLELLT